MKTSLNTPSTVFTTTVLLSGLALLLSGCLSNQPDPTRNFQSYVGLSSSELAKELGKPEQQYQQNGSTILVYRPVSFNMPIPIPATAITGGSGMSMPMAIANAQFQHPDQKVYANCNVYFSLKNDIVQSWQASGKECPKRLLQTQQ